jgi:nucleoside-diphosphate-sugar epimerase
VLSIGSSGVGFEAVQDSPTAFVTGGSGFIGGALLRRLASEGWKTRALARSERSAGSVREAGADPVRGDLTDPDSLREAASGCGVAFHAAAEVSEWGPREDFVRGNVTGTENALRGCREAGVGRFVHVGTEAALMAGQPLVRVDESTPLRPDSKAYYPATKAQAEQAVRSANGNGFETVVVRPRLVWGPGDTTILPGLIDAIERGRFSWIGGGRHLTDTTHVDNVVEGLLLGAERGRAGEAYFVTDGEPVEFREFVTALLATRGIEPPGRNTPPGVARAAAGVLEPLWRLLRRDDPPPVTRLAVWLSSLECTIDTSKAREELGYAPVKTREQGLGELRATV